MGKSRVPESLRRFVERQTTMPVTDLWGGDRKEERSPYGRYWYRAVACLLMSGRVQAKHDGTPNMTDAKRLGKEANFNQYLTQRIGTFLVAMGVIQFDRQNRTTRDRTSPRSGTKMRHACRRSLGRPFRAWSGTMPIIPSGIPRPQRIGA
jgi:hypothetical protein